MYKYIITLIPKLSFSVLLFYLGFYYANLDKDAMIKYVLTIIIVIVSIYYTFNYFIWITKNREINSLQHKLKIVENSLKERIAQWDIFLNIIEDGNLSLKISGNNTSSLDLAEIFNTRTAIKTIVERLGEQFFNDLNIFYPHNDNFARVSYLQREKFSSPNNPTHTIQLRHKENEYFSPNHPLKEKSSSPNYRKKVFELDDISTASYCWRTGKTVFINDTEKELGKSDPHFKKDDDDKYTKSICCIPIERKVGSSGEKYLFGVICFSSNRKNMVDIPYFKNLFHYLQPIVAQLKLIEYVKNVFHLVAENNKIPVSNDDRL